MGQFGMISAGITRCEDELLAQAEVLRTGTAMARIHVRSALPLKGAIGLPEARWDSTDMH